MTERGADQVRHPAPSPLVPRPPTRHHRDERWLLTEARSVRHVCCGDFEVSAVHHGRLSLSLFGFCSQLPFDLTHRRGLGTTNWQGDVSNSAQTSSHRPAMLVQWPCLPSAWRRTGRHWHLQSARLRLQAFLISSLFNDLSVLNWRQQKIGSTIWRLDDASDQFGHGCASNLC